MSWFDSFLDGADDAYRYVFDHRTHQTRRLLWAMAPLARAAAAAGWWCKEPACGHTNGAKARFCGGCGRKRGSPLASEKGISNG